MHTKNTVPFTTLIFLLLFLAAPNVLLAADVTLNVPGDFPTIQGAIDNAALLLSQNPANSYSVFVEPGTYPGGITLKNSIPVEGREAARTIINGGGTVAVTASGVSGVFFRKFTITGASVGIQVSNSSVNITNNIFQTASTAAVQITNSPSTTVVNNTFYQNGTAIQRDADAGAITNNIFYNSANTVQISQGAGITQISITYNLFYPNLNGPTGTHYIPDTTIPALTDPNPLFVAPASGDFHIQLRTPTPSPCVDNGDISITDGIDQTRSDIGAYGGPNADSIPFPVPVPTATPISTSASMSVSWSQNKAYLVTDPSKPGSYNVRYALGGAAATTVNVVSTLTSTTISGLTTTVAAPPAPSITSTSPSDSALSVSWTSASGATGYKLHYGIASVSENTLDVKFTTTYTLFGLINGQRYQIAVSAYAQPIYLVSVSALDNVGPAYNPGIAHESAYSASASVALGAMAESAISAIVTDFPEAIVPLPNLPNKGCFIATAAYGYYSAPQVQALRAFRDRYLMASSPGRAFVEWYYRYGPIGAEFINAHPWTKPAVRIALLPAVGGALFMTRAPFIVKLLVLLGLVSIAAYAIRRKKQFRTGGVR